MLIRTWQAILYLRLGIPLPPSGSPRCLQHGQMWPRNQANLCVHFRISLTTVLNCNIILEIWIAVLQLRIYIGILDCFNRFYIYDVIKEVERTVERATSCNIDMCIWLAISSYSCVYGLTVCSVICSVAYDGCLLYAFDDNTRTCYLGSLRPVSTLAIDSNEPMIIHFLTSAVGTGCILSFILLDLSKNLLFKIMTELYNYLKLRACDC